MKTKHTNNRSEIKIPLALDLLKTPPDDRQVEEARRVLEMALTNPTEQHIWDAIQSLRKKKVITDKFPALALIDKEVTALGHPPVASVQAISKALTKLEEKGYFKRIVVFAA